MKSKTLNLLLTKIGKEKIASLLANGQKSFVKIALGSEYKAFSEIDTQLKHERTRIPANILLVDSGAKLHIQAYLREDNTEFDIHEIGLLLIDPKNEIEPGTLLGIYRTERPLATKNAFVDLFLDITLQIQEYDFSKFIINLPDYQPIFELSPATHEKLGAVRLASEKSIQEETDELVLSTKNLASEEIIKQKKPGFILTTNHLTSIFYQKKTYGWNRIKNREWLYTAEKPITEISFTGLFFLASKNSIYMLYSLLLGKTVENSVFLVKYNIQSNTSVVYPISKKNEFSNISFSNQSPCGEYNDESSINFYFLTKALSKLGNPDINQLKIDIDKDNQDIDFTLTKGESVLEGKIFLYNKQIGSISKDKIDLLASISLRNKQQIAIPYETDDPLVHIIQDKIYCLEGEVSKVKIFYLKNNEASGFIPTATSNINIQDTEGLTSVVLNNYIYIFKPDTYYTDSSGPYNFYQYNILDNQWQTLPFPEEHLLNKSPTFKLGTAVTVGSDIYLFCSEISEENKIDLSLLKFTPP